MKVARAVDTATIMALRGRLDVYHDKQRGWIARTWPRGRQNGQTPGELVGIENFRAMVQYAGSSDGTVRAHWKSWMEGQGVTWVDANRAVAAGKVWIGVG